MTLIDQLCAHCDGDGCAKCHDGWKRKRGRPLKDSEKRGKRHDLRMTQSDREAIEHAKRPGESMNDAALRLVRAGYKSSASSEYKKALRNGAITPATECSVCGSSGAIHGHHRDYSRPLEVVWLCASCHASKPHGLEAHRKPGRGPSYLPQACIWAALEARGLLIRQEASNYRTGKRNPSRMVLRAWEALGYVPGERWPERIRD